MSDGTAERWHQDTSVVPADASLEEVAESASKGLRRRFSTGSG